MFKEVPSVPNFVENEKNLLDKWYSEGIVNEYLNRNNSAKKRYSFLDGPMTANNPMGVHHAWGRTYKDLYQRFYNMLGFKQRFQNGFDCQGLWVEVEVEKELGFKNKKDIERFGIDKFIELCKRRVRKYAKIQTEQSKRLGYFMDWDNSYYTMSDENNYMIWYFLKRCYEKGFLYKGRDSVPWCPRCGTAISQHEMLTETYRALKHKSLYVKYPVIGQRNTYLLIWTTTPWTLPANIAVAVDPKKEYLLVEGRVPGDKYYILKKRADNLGLKPLKTLKGDGLVGLTYVSPFDDLERVRRSLGAYKHTVVATDPLIMPINEEEGTGLVHVATGAGSEDFQLGKKLGLPVIEVIDEEAHYLGGLGAFSGVSAKDNPSVIIDYLKEKDVLFDVEEYTHRYPVCWRCKTELVWRVVDEWYIGMDIPDPEVPGKKTLRAQLIDVAKEVKWIPGFGLDRELDWLENMHDWLISKKRYWGLALPIFECPKCGNFEVIGGFEELKRRSVEGWEKFRGHSPHRPWVDKVKIRCSKCKTVISRIPDVGNPWLDAGIVPFSTLIDPVTKKVSYLTDKKYWRTWFPADFVTESFPGQFKNWFYSLLAMSTVLEGTRPFKTLFGYMTVVDEKGEEMHKSAGNSIEFNAAADRVGADVMRWHYVRSNPFSNLKFGFNVLGEVRKRFLLILWNTYRFFVTYSRLDGFVPQETLPQDLTVLDKWIISKLNGLIKEVTISLKRYNASSAAKSIEEFVVSDLSTWYIRRIRDKVGPTALCEDEKNNVHAVLYKVFITLSKLLTPFIPFISEEMYLNISKNKRSVNLETWPAYKDALIDKDLEDRMDLVRQLVEKVHSWRKQNAVRVRMPLKTVEYLSPEKLQMDFEGIIKDETNIKNLKWKKAKNTSIKVLDKGEDDEKIIAEGIARDIVRDIQDLRKKSKCKFDEKVVVTYPENDKTRLALKYFRKYILTRALVKELKPAKTYEIV